MNLLGTGCEGRARTIALLLATASATGLMTATAARADEAAPGAVTALATDAAAAAAPAPAAPAAVQEIVVTGTHIRGVQAVGQPVTTLTDKEFKTAGAVTIGDLLETVPQITMIADSNVINGGGYVARDQNINIRNLSQKGTRTLLMIDGMRFPNQGNGGCQTDPSIIPQLAVERVDVLANGASAEYGSDAVAGVVNVVLKRRYQGLTTQFSYNQSQDIGGARATIAALFGKKWETPNGLSGDFTGSFEAYSTAHVSGGALPKLFTANFAIYGFDNRMQFANSMPAIVSAGNPSAVPGGPASFSLSGLNCSNCYSVPKGQNGQGLTWAQILANPGVGNEYNNFYDGWISPSQTRAGFTAAFDQEITPDVEFFADAWFNDRKTTMHSQSQGLSNYALPASYKNPFTPVGAPNNLVLNFDLTTENPIIVTTKELASRLDGGFNFNLPLMWKGKFTYAHSDIHEFNDSYGGPTKNNVIAALGGTTTAVAGTATTPAIPSYTKPAGIPYLDPFCDGQAFANCNSAATLAYISGYSYANEEEVVNEFNLTADGPIVHLPGGDLKAAFGALYTATTYSNMGIGTNANANAVLNITQANGTRYVGSTFFEFDIPVFGETFTAPLFKRLNIEVAARYDHYNQFGETWNPKASGDWTLGWGFTLKGSVGTSFRAPSFQENANGGAGAVNSAVGTGAANTVGTCPVVGVPAVPGSIAALIDPNCSQALQFLGGLSLLNSAQSAAAIRPGGVHLTPEKGYNIDYGIEFRPTVEDGPFAFLNGLDLQVTYWNLRLVNKLQGYFGLAAVTSGTLDNPVYTPAFLTAATDPQFAQHVAALVSSPYSSLPASVTAAGNNLTPGVAFIADGAIRNIGWQYLDGIDLQGNYLWRWDGVKGWGAGAYNAGITGAYSNKNVSNGGPGQANVNYYTLNNDGRFRYRLRLGWQGVDSWLSGLSLTGFMNYIPHFNPIGNPLPPSCFLIANTACNASGTPQFAQYTQRYARLTNYVKDVYTTDLNISYFTGPAPTNSWLRNLRVSLTIQNLFNKQPPFQYAISPPGGGAPHAFYTSTASQELAIGGRIFNLTLTKEW
jgi:iron complex outermembrane receptor protein